MEQLFGAKPKVQLPVEGAKPIKHHPSGCAGVWPLRQEPDGGVV